MEQRKTIEVVAAIIIRDGKLYTITGSLVR